MKTKKTEEIINKINELRTKNVQIFQTNYFMTQLDDECLCLENNDAILFLQPEYDFYRLYFAYTELNFFQNLLKKIPKNIVYSIEIIQKKEINTFLKETINKYAPFSTKFIRMRVPVEKIRVQTVYNPQDIEYAYEKDVDFIHDTMFKTFSKYYSHIQTKSQLLEYVKKNQIIVTRDNKEIKSFLIYTVNGIQSHNNQGINVDGNPVYGIKMLDYYSAKMKELEVKSIYLWVDTINSKSVQKMHEYYGYKPDGLSNFIFVKY